MQSTIRKFQKANAFILRKIICKKQFKDNKEAILFKLTNVAVFALIVLGSVGMAGQEHKTKKIVPPIDVTRAFEKAFPQETPVWTKDFGGEDSDQIRYKAKFKTNASEGLAVYDNRGDLKAYEVSIQKKDIPSNAVRYLSTKYENFIIDEASRVKNDKNETTYEVGIVRDGKFYDAVFDHNGDFLETIQKD